MYRKKSLKGIWKSLQKLSRQWKIWKLQWNCAGCVSRHWNCAGSVRWHWHFIFPFSFGFFNENNGNISNEHGERFHQDISQMGKKYSGKWNPNIMADYCLRITSATWSGKYKRWEKKKWVFNEFFVVRILYIVTVHYLTLYVTIKNQYIALLLQT